MARRSPEHVKTLAASAVRRATGQARLQDGLQDRAGIFRAIEPNRGRRGRSARARSVRPPPYLHEHMFPTLTTRRPSNRSLRERVRDAVGTALEFATLGEATLGPAAPQAPVPQPAPAHSARSTAPTVAHPHRRRLIVSTMRAGAASVRPRAQVCTHAGLTPGAGADLTRTAPRSGRTGAPDGLQRLSGRRRIGRPECRWGSLAPSRGRTSTPAGWGGAFRRRAAHRASPRRCVPRQTSPSPTEAHVG